MVSAFLDVVDAARTAPCLLCPNWEAITLPLKKITFPGFEFVNNCQALSDLVRPRALLQESSQCALVQSIGTICGCPKKENACNLCVDGGKAVYGWSEKDSLADSFGEEIVPTCEIVEAGLHSYNDTDPYCYGSQLLLSEYCGCGADEANLESEPVPCTRRRATLFFVFSWGGSSVPKQDT
jgi:hypothetical protein